MIHARGVRHLESNLLVGLVVDDHQPGQPLRDDLAGKPASFGCGLVQAARVRRIIADGALAMD